MKDPGRLTARQLEALRVGSIIRVPAAIDVKGAKLPRTGNFRIERVDENGEDPLAAVLDRFQPSEALALLSYVEKMLRIWDGEAAVSEGLAKVISHELLRGFLIPAPPLPDDVLHLVYVRTSGGEIVLLGGYGTEDSPSSIELAVAEALRRNPDVITW